MQPFTDNFRDADPLDALLGGPSLASGSTAHLRLPRSSRLLVESGAVRLTTRQWLGERCVAVSVRLDAGAIHAADTAGWACVQALPGEAVRLRSLPAPASRLAALCKAGRQRLAHWLAPEITTLPLHSRA